MSWHKSNFRREKIQLITMFHFVCFTHHPILGVWIKSIAMGSRKNAPCVESYFPQGIKVVSKNAAPTHAGASCKRRKHKSHVSSAVLYSYPRAQVIKPVHANVEQLCGSRAVQLIQWSSSEKDLPYSAAQSSRDAFVIKRTGQHYCSDTLLRNYANIWNDILSQECRGRTMEKGGINGA